MAIYEVQAPDGSVFEIEGPDDATDDQIAAFAESQFSGGQQRQAPQQAQPEPEQDAPYFGLDAAKARVRGIAQTTVVPAAQLSSRLAATVGNAVSDVAGWPRSEYLNKLPERADMFAEELREQPGGGMAQIEGQLIGSLPAGGLRLAQAGARFAPLINRAAQGAVQGAQFAPTNEAGAAANVGTGAVAGAVIPPALARIASPAANGAVRMLADRGVRLTPGQILGPTAKRVEDAARSVPLLGDAITAAQRRSFASFNEAVINDALQPINGRVQGAGREAVESAQQQVSNAYESLLPQLRVVADGPFRQEMQSIRQMAAALPPRLRPDFDHIVQTEVLSRFTPQGRMSGETMKLVESQLGKLAQATARRTDDAYAPQMADGIRELQAILRRTVERSNPQHAGQLQAVNQSFARMQRVNTAAAANREDGIFTPEAFSGAVRAGDTSKGKRNFAAGNALSQDFSDAARQVMGNRVADSGTARRLLLAGLGGGAAAGGAYYIDPHVLTAGAAASAPYLPGVGAVVRNALLRRPAGAAQFANALRNRGNALAVPLAGSAIE